MKIQILSAFIICANLSCSIENNKEDHKEILLVNKIPDSRPLNFKKELVPNNKIIHRGIFSPDLKEYYFTISNKDFTDFDVLFIKKVKDKWSVPQEAFFNSDFNEHGMNFSPDGKTLYFSSTRPVIYNEVPTTWHIWKTEQKNETWTKPVFVDIPNMRGKLVSHPSVSKSGTIYFHASNLDYTEMNIYSSKRVNGKYEIARKLNLSRGAEENYCTPFVSPDEDYLIYASVGTQLDLMISFNNGDENWTDPRVLDAKINDGGQGNPYVTPDNNFLFFATGKDPENWYIKWVSFKPQSLNNYR
ncbi:TolB-like translocation protein [Daejeonella oryzae]|uniref:PD40 domain-containing protein n=1 Tax=Daejeonella oryzae TaxID=1122943 RepID=UPI000416A596|nr:PD40 domain-containing protein [Daejeonella oryzae]